MMFRFRRYRAFLAVAVLCVLTVYYLTLDGAWDTAANISVEQLKGFSNKGQSAESEKGTATEFSTDDSSPAKVDDKAALQVTSAPVVDDALVAPPAPPSTSSSTSSSTSTLEDLIVPTPKTPTRPSKVSDLTEDPDTEPAIPAEQIKEQFGQHGQSRLEAKPFRPELPQSHWTKQPQNFPVPPASIIPLPTGRVKKIPKIQKTFKAESSTAKTERERKLAAIKDAFLHAWTGYKEKALPHDEVKPISGEYRDPFNGWGATLVDTLDTLWIMGLKSEFESAVDSVAKIDFTTSLRKDIPLFETTIRYLGGLLSAYDISSQKFPVLLDKAQELAEILIGAFDTPNRMPLTYYNWAPSYASQPHRAGTRVVMAELGSLSMEFTRLAQLTKEDKYYDAVARVTNALEQWQGSTRLPGLWPIYVDTSGCKKPEQELASKLEPPGRIKQEPLKEEPAKDGATILERKPKAKDKSHVSRSDIEDSLAETTSDAKKVLAKRQLDDFETDSDTGESAEKKPNSAKLSENSANSPTLDLSDILEQSLNDVEMFEDVDCEPQGLASPPYEVMDTFTLGAMSDSTFEYLPKQYMLLGGQLDQYQTMYESAMDTARDTLLYRPMTPDNRDILFAGKFETPIKSQIEDDDDPSDLSSSQPKSRMIHEGAHLTCFAGGMFAIGAKIFGIDGDLDIGRRLADGCVWAYDVSASGIMPEEFNLVACDNTKTCTWSDKAWWDALDPDPTSRMERVKDWNKNQRQLAEQLAAAEAKEELEDSDMQTPEAKPSAERYVIGETRPAASNDADLVKRQVVKSSIQKEDDVTAATSRNKVIPSDDAEAGSESVPLGKSSIRYENDETIAAAAAAALGDANPVDETPSRSSSSKTTIDGVSGTVASDSDPVTEVMKSIFTPEPVVSHEEFAQAVARERRLPPGFASIGRREYILRPEAIESVFIMFRITGEESWREKGWRMFNAIQKHTRTEFANSAINDVTSAIPEFRDSMESFWLAETLKYFYLLFSEPDVVSLDDWVLNTEAHPFRRPQSSFI